MYLYQIASIFRQFQFSQIFSTIQINFPQKNWNKNQMDFKIPMKYLRPNTNMFERFKSLKNFNILHKTSKKTHQKLLSTHTKIKNIFEHFNLANILLNNKTKIL